MISLWSNLTLHLPLCTLCHTSNTCHLSSTLTPDTRHLLPILVTGGAGFIGSHLVERLIASGHAPIRVLDNFQRGRKENLASCWDRIEFLPGDIRVCEIS